MAIDTPARHIYSGDGSTRVYPIPTYIQGDDYIRIEINGVHQVDRSKWDIVNNSIIFVTAPITTATIDVQVATSVEALAELGSVTNVDIVAANIVGISGIASNLDEILLTNDNSIIATTKASEASASALVAITKASEASASATSAGSSATTATTKASEASTSATTATTKASEAAASATSALSGATTSTTKASESLASALVATTKASEASASATSAGSSATIASSGATTATTKANEASSGATTATTKANEASASASTATTKASEASAVALVATTKASEASASATSASSGATTSTTKANEASTSAINALASENKAKKWADESVDVPVESGLYSSKHWAAKAAEIVGGGLIDDVSPSTSTVFSSTRSNNTYEPKNNNIQGHISNNTTNPHNVTKSQVGLSNVDNTSDIDKPVSSAQAAAIVLKQDTLVSGTNIKTVNSSSILCSGNLELLTSINPVITGSITEQVYNLTGTAINPANGTIQYKTVSANTTFTETLTSGQSVLLRLIGASNYTITFPTITWVGAAAPVLTANCAIVLWKEQSTLYGSFIGTLV